MKQFLQILFIVFILIGGTVSAQNTFKAIIKSDEEEPEILVAAAAHVLGTDIAVLADSNGLIILQNIPDGDQTIEFSLAGYFRKRIKLKFPLTQNAGVVEVRLQSQAEEVEEVVVSATRNYQKPEYLPTQVDVMNADEVEQESHDKPSDISHVLQEQPGVQVQRTSAISGTFGIRLQGLSPDYTQIVQDGFPLFAGLTSDIGISQILPLDLKQIEIIKGPSSTLYGGDAIAGVINLVTKEPTDKPIYDLMFNGESAKAFDGGFYASQKIKWFAFSLTGAYRYQQQKDWSGYGFTETPYLQRFIISPQLYFDLSKYVKLDAGVNYTHEYRVGGTDAWFDHTSDSIDTYYEKNTSQHILTKTRLTADFGSKGTLTIKNAVNLFSRELQLPYYLFSGNQLASYSEISYRFIHKRHELVAGIDFKSDKFTEGHDSSAIVRNYSFLTIGIFGQYLFHLDEKTTFEAGFRVDYNNVYKVYPLPHAAILEKWNNIFSTRANFGMGYKLPTIFQDQSEDVRFINVSPIAQNVVPELSLGGTVDLRVKLPNFAGVNITIHQMYFITHILHPMQADTVSIPNCPNNDCIQTYYQNGGGYLQTDGIETGLSLTYRGLEFGVNYTLTDSHLHYDSVLEINPLTSKHIVAILAGYSIKNFFIGTDCYYYSPVKLSDGSVGHSIWEIGISTQYAFKYFLLFANLENIANIRQTTYGPIVFPNPTYSHPAFAEIYGPLEGRLFNAGFKFHLAAFAKKKGGENGKRDTD